MTSSASPPILPQQAGRGGRGCCRDGLMIFGRMVTALTTGRWFGLLSTLWLGAVLATYYWATSGYYAEKWHAFSAFFLKVAP